MFGILVSAGLFALVVAMKLIGSALGDTWGFTAFLAKLPWWPDVVGAAIAASIFPWLPALL